MIVTSIHGVQKVTATSHRISVSDEIKSAIRLSIDHDGERTEFTLFVDGDVSTADILTVLS
jgi:hypothetical protein